MALTVTETNLDFVKIETDEKVLYIKKNTVIGIGYRKAEKIMTIIAGNGKYTTKEVEVGEFALVEALIG